MTQDPIQFIVKHLQQPRLVEDPNGTKWVCDNGRWIRVKQLPKFKRAPKRSPWQ
jgi:hypothetical protein